MHRTRARRITGPTARPAHTLRLLTPGTLTPGTTGPQATALVGTTRVAPAALVEVRTPGTVRVDGPAELAATIAAGRVAATGAITVRSR